MLDAKPLEVKDFSGGMTDNYLAGPTNAGQLYDNLLINNNAKPFTRFGSTIRDLTYYQVPSGEKRISHIWDHRDQILEQTERHIFYLSSGYNELLGPSGNAAFSANTESDHISKSFWNNHSLCVSDSFAKPIKVYKNDLGVFKVVTAGLPAITAPTVTAGGAGANNYIYGFAYYYSYNVEGVTFEDFGATAQVSLSSSLAPDVSAVAITSIPVISNGFTDNYDTTAIKVKIYRTENDGTVLKYIGEVTNGTTTYNDSASDASITNNVTIYTTGDIVDNDPPPPAKYVHVSNDIALYGHVKEGSVVVPNRLRQSIRGDIDSCPEDFFLDLPDEIMGVSSFQGTWIVFCKSSCYRVDGSFDEQGRGGLSYLRISDTVGTVSNDSIIQTDQGLVFAAQQGFYFTDGYRVQKISHHLNETYKTLVATDAQARNIYGAFDEIENRIWYAVQQDSSSLDNDSCFILDLTWGIREESTFTTASGGDSFRPTALLFKEGDLYRADSRGFIFLHTSIDKTDPEVNVSEFPVNWNTQAIIHDYISSAYDFGTSFIRKLVSKILTTFANVTNLAVQIYGNNDDGKKILALSPIRYNSNIVWGDPNVVWGDDSIIWNQRGLIEEKRYFPATGLRCNYKQIRITNAYTTITKSDLLGNVTLDAAAKTVTFDDVTKVWPTEYEGYYISFANDSYETQFKIVERTSDTVLTIQDPLSELPASGSYQWLIKGYRKGEILNMLSYVIHFKFITDSQKSYHFPQDSGGNST